MASMRTPPIKARPKRHPKIRALNLPSSFPVDLPSWEEAWEGAVTRADLDRDGRSSRLRVISWNVWFDALYAEERFDALVRILLTRDPDVVCLQEVVPKFAQSLRASKILSNRFAISDNDVDPYSVLMLVRKELEPVFREIELDSMMNRSLLVAELQGGWKRAGVVATAHFESLNSANVRRGQLRTCHQVLGVSSSLYANAIIVGDFNFDDLQEWGDWRSKGNPCPFLTENAEAVGVSTAPEEGRGLFKRPAHELENRVLGEELPEFEDQWPLLCPNERGATFDGRTNPICVRDSQEVMRYDRVLLRAAQPPPISSRVMGALQGLLGRGATSTQGEEGGQADQTNPPDPWEGAHIQLLGTEAINAEGVKPSDHYGLEFDCRPRQARKGPIDQKRR